MEFLTKWEGAEVGEETWEPLEHFIPFYNYKIVEYVKAHKLNIDLSTYLSPNPT